MTKEMLIEELKKAKRKYAGDTECLHLKADDLLLAFIDDPEITKVYGSIQKWYA